MKSALLLAAIAAIFCLSSCVSTKQLTYLQEDLQTTDTLISLRKIKEPYRVQINDMLSIRVKSLDQELMSMFNPVGESNLNATGEERLYYDGFTVDQHGKIRVPNLGYISVLGYTVDEIREMLETKIREEYLNDVAQLFITVKLAGIRYIINGEINGPGSSIIYRDQVTIMEAIATNGDITTVGDRSNVVVIRQYPQGQKVHHIDLTSIDAVNSPFYYVQPNDLILINPLPQKALGTGTTGLSSFTTVLSIVSAVATVILLFVRL